MKSILHVKNFGPIKDAKLDLRSVNVLIGPQASGKSTLAKLFTICKSPVMYFELKEDMFSLLDGPESMVLHKSSYEKFLKTLDFFSLTGYYSSETEISFESSTHSLIIKDSNLSFNDNLNIDKFYELDVDTEQDKILDFAIELDKKTSYVRNKIAANLFIKGLLNSGNLTKIDDIYEGFEEFQDLLETEHIFNLENLPFIKHTILSFKNVVYRNEAIYIPAERTIVNLIKQASLNFQRSNIPIAGHLLDYAAKYETATFAVKNFSLDFLSKEAEYRNENGEDRIYFSQNESIRLTDSASGFQSVVPMLLPLVHAQEEKEKQSAFVIEEPETNLFPGAQYEVLKFIERGRKNDLGMIDKGAMHIYTTHSPFILSSLNNMLFGFKKGNGADKSIKKKIKKVISEENWINPDDFSAYEIKNGKVKSIFSRKTGLINETVIDVVSEDIMNDFRKIAVISAEANVEK